jgi:hypothetical protein
VADELKGASAYTRKKINEECLLIGMKHAFNYFDARKCCIVITLHKIHD